MPYRQDYWRLYNSVEAWNQWRREEAIDAVDLRGDNFTNARLVGANLRGANLEGANLSGADLSGADLTGANFTKTTLTGAIIDLKTRWSGAKGVTIGINGFYCRDTRTAAVTRPLPEGDSMIGSSPYVIIDSLKQARRYHSISVTTTLTLMANQLFNLTSGEEKKGLTFPVIGTVELKYVVTIGMIISVVVLIMCLSALYDALKATRYLQSRNDAMQVGHFPWPLTTFSGDSWKEVLGRATMIPKRSLSQITDYSFGNRLTNMRKVVSGLRQSVSRQSLVEFTEPVIRKLLSLTMRIILSFHCGLYFFTKNLWSLPDNRFLSSGKMLNLTLIVLLLLSLYTYFLSSRFQRPIVFDIEKEERAESETMKLVTATEEQTRSLNRLIELVDRHYPDLASQMAVTQEEIAPGVRYDFVTVPKGEFHMGSKSSEVGRFDDEGPVHLVKLESFQIGRYPVTQVQWIAVMGRLPDTLVVGHEDWKGFVEWYKQFRPELIEAKLEEEAMKSFIGDDLPVVGVSWEKAKEFLKELGDQYRLPTESEWEYAARAGTTTAYAFGQTVTSEHVNFNGEHQVGRDVKGKFRRGLVPVGSLGMPNGWGIYDMHGNVWEWCEDRWHDNYEGAPKDGRAWESGESEYRVVRGGSWDYNGDYCRSANRGRYLPGDRYDVIGLRIVVGARTSGT